MNLTENLWGVDEFAGLTKVTVRTLHYYDRRGLLKPHRRTAKGFRLYGMSEFARLQQILTLKFIGFSLKQIKEILGQQEFDLGEVLHLQRKVVEKQIKRLEIALKAISQAEQIFEKDKSADLESFRQIVEVINMEQNWEWTKKYYSEEAIEKIEERKSLWSPELQERVTKDWENLVGDIEAATADDVSPSDLKAQELAARWTNLIEEFTGGNAEIRAGLDKMYADEKNWQAEWKKPYSEEVEQFISAAIKESKAKN